MKIEERARAQLVVVRVHMKKNCNWNLKVEVVVAMFDAKIVHRGLCAIAGLTTGFQK